MGRRASTDLLAGGASPASAGHSSRVRVGRSVRSSLAAGRVRFSVPLAARARAALKRRGHLALSVKIVLMPASGPPATLTRGVLLRR